MKIVNTQLVIEAGDFSKTREWSEARDEVIRSIQQVKWPPSSGKFIIYPEENANGVNPITEQFENNLDGEASWESTGRKWFNKLLEKNDMLSDSLKKLECYYEDPEEFISSPWFDAMKTVEVDGEKSLIVAEWETGNISSSHRSLNRITLGLVSGIIKGGFVILPSRLLYKYLTDRIGNFQELEPYLLIWESLSSEIEEGTLEIIVVEHDEVSEGIPPIGKLTDGMADREIPDSVDFENMGSQQQSGLSDY